MLLNGPFVHSELKGHLRDSDVESGTCLGLLPMQPQE